MFGINDNCKLDQFVAKKNFYTYSDMSSSDKDLFKDNISKITLTYQLQPNKINIMVLNLLTLSKKQDLLLLSMNRNLLIQHQNQKKQSHH